MWIIVAFLFSLRGIAPYPVFWIVRLLITYLDSSYTFLRLPPAMTSHPSNVYGNLVGLELKDFSYAYALIVGSI